MGPRPSGQVKSTNRASEDIEQFDFHTFQKRSIESDPDTSVHGNQSEIKPVTGHRFNIIGPCTMGRTTDMGSFGTAGPER